MRPPFLLLLAPLAAALRAPLLPTPRAPAVARRRACALDMLAKKPFKGGRLDDFVAAGEAESKYGPQRYAALAQDAWRIEVEQVAKREARALSKEEYAAQKAQMLQDHAFLSALGLASVWALVGAAQAPSYAAGALLGALYLVLLQKEADAFGAAFTAADDEEERALPAPPPQVVPVLMVLLVGKYNAVLQLLPVLAGFFTSKLATLYQAAYPEGFTARMAGEDEARG